MYDFHVHSEYSPDSSMPMEKAISAAIKKGLKEICFTDHTDYDYDGEGNHFQFNFDEYIKEIENYQKKYKNQIIIRKGVEFGLQPHIIKHYQEDTENYDFDFVICSIHSVEKNDLYMGNFFNNKSQKKAYEVYFQELSDVVSNYTDYSVLGHLDIIKRYGGFDFSLPLEEYKDYTGSILKKVIKNGKGIELNTSGIRYMLGDYHPSIEIMKLYHDLGGEIVTLGSDSHVPEHIAFDFENALKHLKDIGFEYISSFEKMKPVFHKIDDLL